VEIIERRQGYKIACLEEIAFANDWLGKDELLRAAESMQENTYGRYLLSLFNESA